MKYNNLFIIIALIFLFGIFLWLNCPSTNEHVLFEEYCDVLYYDEVPDDRQHDITQEEVDELDELENGDYELFRVRRTTGGNGVNIGSIGGRGGRIGGRGGRIRHRPWRRWPHRRPYRYYRPWAWYTYPTILTYPSTYYTTTWQQPSTRYIIRLREKENTHPFYGQGYSKGFTANGSSGGTLVLKRGYSYEFDVSTLSDSVTQEPENEPFFFTYNAEGGDMKDAVFIKSPTSNGTVRITIPNDFPKRPEGQTYDFFYMSTNHTYVGGYVVIN